MRRSFKIKPQITDNGLCITYWVYIWNGWIRGWTCVCGFASLKRAEQEIKRLANHYKDIDRAKADVRHKFDRLFMFYRYDADGNPKRRIQR